MKLLALAIVVAAVVALVVGLRATSHPAHHCYDRLQHPVACP
jgi:hypothetical protein